MSDRPHFMQLDPNEDATSVRDRLSFVRGQRVLLVWPESGTVLTRKLDLVLIQREAMRRAIRLALVTHDPQVIKNAAELNISTFETVGESERKRWKRGRSKVFTKRHQKPTNDPLPEELQEVASRVKNPDEPRPLRQMLTRLAVVLVVVGIVLGVAFVVLPTATITLIPAQDIVEVTVTINASPDAANINVEQGIIPMTRLRVETTQSGTIDTTGAQPLSAARAAGTVVFINRTGAAVEVPAGTLVSTSAGTPVQFRTLETVTLPAGVGLQIEVGIEALQDFAGPIGNVGEGQVNTVVGDLSAQVDVRNAVPTSGGETRTTAAVSESDITRLESMVRQQIQSQAYTEMQPLLSESQFIILDSVRITEERDDWKTFSADEGDTVETLSLDMRAVVEAVAVDEQFGRQIAFASLSNLIPRGRVIEPGSVDYTRGAVSGALPGGGITFDITASAVVVEPVDIGQMQQQLAGRSLPDAMTYIVNQIETQNGAAPRITLSPSWARRMPLLPFRIRVQLQETAS